MKRLLQHLVIATGSLSLSGLQAQDQFLPVPSSVVSAVAEALPERPGVGAAFLSNEYSPNLVMTGSSRIRVIFVNELAGYHNSLGYFTWRLNSGAVEILTSDLLFPNLDRRTLNRGDSVWLKDGGGSPRTFNAGDHIGFFVISDGWRQATSTVQGWTYSPGIPSTTPATNEALGRGTFTSIDEINPEYPEDRELAKHVAMMTFSGEAGFLDGRDFFLLGFEDLLRTGNSDDDFNDCVFLVDVETAGAAGGTDVAPYINGDPDDDGVRGGNDIFPNDSNRCFVRRIPSKGYHVIAFEDNYPQLGDADFNDAVIAFSYTLVTNRRNRVKDLIADFHLVARGAAFDHAFGMHMPKLPDTATGTVSLQRILSGGTMSSIATRSLLSVNIGSQGRISDIFPSTQTALPPPNESTRFANTTLEHPMVEAASTRVHIEFNTPVHATRELAINKLDLFLVVTDSSGVIADVHQPGFSAFPNVRTAGLPAESGRRAFLDDDGNPWAIRIPTSWRFPLEYTNIRLAYPNYPAWRASNGRTNKNWYRRPSDDTSFYSARIRTLIPSREWTLLGPFATN